jgi:diacylglycerol kinase family enzyme
VADGQPVWQKELKAEYKIEAPFWGFCGHPLVDGQKLICLVGGEGSVAVAFDKDSGKELWKTLSATGDAGYCPPTIIEAGGQRQLLIWHPKALSSLNPDTGEVYWSEPLEPQYGMSVAAPVKSGDLLYASGIGSVAALFRLDKAKPAVKVVWDGKPNTAVYCSNSTPIIDGGVIYGNDCQVGNLRGVELVTGKRLWETFEPTTGGDGTVSGMAAALCGTDIAMGILPLGTMNLFARSVGMPLDLDEGLAALAGAKTRKIDLGEVNGRVFTHHVSMGLQPRLVAMREKSDYGSRAGKIFATFRALLTIMRQPPRLQVRMTLEGKDFDVETPALVVSNNMFGPAHLPYADALDQGVLGIYICTSHSPADVAQVTLEALLGSWHARDRIKTLSARAITVERRSRRRRRIVATVDGELVTFDGAIEMKIRPGCLTVLAPEPAPPSEDGDETAPAAS